MSKIKLMAVVAGLHAGSTVGLLPPDFKTIEGTEVRQNAIQQWLWTCWQDALGYVHEIAGDDELALVNNGDSVEGVHHRTTQVISPDVQDHVNAAIALLDPLVKRASRFFVVRGTECHTNNREITIGKAMGAEINPEIGIPAFDRLTIDVNGVRCVFRHHMTTSMRTYLEASAMSIHLAEEQLQAARNGEPIPRIVCAAHRHCHGYYGTAREMFIVSPPWQALTRFGHKVVSDKRTKPGLYLLDWRGKKPGELPEVHERLYDAPQPKAIKL